MMILASSAISCIISVIATSIISFLLYRDRLNKLLDADRREVALERLKELKQ